MAEVKRIENRTITKLFNRGVTKIKLSHQEVEMLSEAGSPVSALTALIQTAGPFVAAAIAGVYG